MDYGTAYIPSKGVTVNLTECATCGGMLAVGAAGHSPGGEAADTQRHKDAAAAAERQNR